MWRSKHLLAASSRTCAVFVSNCNFCWFCRHFFHPFDNHWRRLERPRFHGNFLPVFTHFHTAWCFFYHRRDIQGKIRRQNIENRRPRRRRHVSFIFIRPLRCSWKRLVLFLIRKQSATPSKCHTVSRLSLLFQNDSIQLHARQWSPKWLSLFST